MSIFGKTNTFTPVKVGDHLTVHRHGAIYYIAIMAVEARLAGDFDNFNRAVDAAKEADEIVDWGSLMESAKVGRFPQRLAQYAEILKDIVLRHGARPSHDKPLTQAEVIGRLKAKDRT